MTNLRAATKAYKIPPPVFIVAILCVASFLAGCGWEDSGRIERDFTTMDLLLPIGKMPPGWEVSGEPKAMSAGEGDKDDSRAAFKPLAERNNKARHWIWQFGNIAEASKEYERMALSEFNSNSVAVEGPWRTPSDWFYQSPDADQFYMACVINTVVTTKQVCEAMWQYDEFVVVFSSIMDTDLMTLEQFKGVVTEIDQIMVSYLVAD
jgi:hypothetical protein